MVDPSSPPLILGSDHAGFALKRQLMSLLEERGYTVQDVGCHAAERCDYPDFGHAVGRAVAASPGTLGVVVCGSGIGISMAANKIPGVRCALCTDVTMARLSRAHNDANVLALGERLMGEETAKDVLLAFLEGQFEGGRHQGRVDKLDPA